MAEVDGYQVIIKLLNEIKGLIKSQDSLIPVYAALAGALIGSAVPIAGKIFSDWRDRLPTSKAVASQLSAEIKVILDIVDARSYIPFIQQEIAKLVGIPNGKSILQIHISEDVMPIYKANLEKLHLLERDTQVKVIKFYRYLTALIEDVKLGGAFNDQRFGFTVASGNQFLLIANEAVKLGNELVDSLENFGNKKCC